MGRKSSSVLGGDIMASSTFATPKPLEDPLAHLPCSTIVEYRKGQIIYSQDQPSTTLYLVIDGKVKVSRVADDGHQVVVDIYQADEFFGESAFLNLSHRCEQATALENAKLMTWTTAEIEDIATKRPRLAVALLQILVQRTVDFTHRIESFSLDNIARRLARALIRFAEGDHPLSRCVQGMAPAGRLSPRWFIKTRSAEPLSSPLHWSA